jgi:hypothetical protein
MKCTLKFWAKKNGQDLEISVIFLMSERLEKQANADNCNMHNIQIWLTPRLAIIIGNDTRRGTSPSCASEVSSFILTISLPSSEVVRHVSQHELGTTFSRSGFFCNNTTTHQSKPCCIMTQTNIISLQQRTIFIYGRSDNGIGISEHILIWSINHITTVTTVFHLHTGDMWYQQDGTPHSLPSWRKRLL